MTGYITLENEADCCVFIDRMWDLENEENYILTLDGHSGYDSNETITCIHFCEKKGKKSKHLFHTTLIFANENPDYTCCTSNFKQTFIQQNIEYSLNFFQLEIGNFPPKIGKKRYFLALGI